ncbi:MAG: cytochrome c [Gammaproteobacteria bacterium]
MDIRTISIALLLASVVYVNNALAGDPFAGSSIYAHYCVSCHGGDGAGEVAGTPSFRGGRLLTKNPMELKSTIRMGRDMMPAFQGVLTEQQIDDVMEYIRTFN